MPICSSKDSTCSNTFSVVELVILSRQAQKPGLARRLYEFLQTFVHLVPVVKLAFDQFRLDGGLGRRCHVLP